MVTMFGVLEALVAPGLSTATMVAVPVPAATLTRPTLTGAAMRRVIRGPHPLGVHPVHDPVELFDDAVETAGRVVGSRGPLVGLRVLRPPREMKPARHGPHERQTSSQGEPVPGAFHRRSSGCVVVRPPGFGSAPRQQYAAPDMNAPAAEKFRDPCLVDFGTDAGGRGRRLELLGTVLVDRPLILPSLPPPHSDRWSGAGAVFRAGPAGGGREGTWTFSAPLPEPWQVAVPLASATLSLEVRPAPSGQLGVFLEQAEQWAWLERCWLERRSPAGATILCLFAHSGAATLAMAAAGARVVHVDASRQAVALARRNAAASGLASAPIRWVCEDARTFVTRELRRGTRYDGVVLDPPSWGHGPKGQAFAIDRDLVPLLSDLATLVGTATGSGPAGPLLLTCHSPRWHHRRLHDTLAGAWPPGRYESGPLTCTDAAGRTLALGDYARRCPD